LHSSEGPTYPTNPSLKGRAFSDSKISFSDVTSSASNAILELWKRIEPAGSSRDRDVEGREVQSRVIPPEPLCCLSEVTWDEAMT
jgi:hypothetical protein